MKTLLLHWLCLLSLGCCLTDPPSLIAQTERQVAITGDQGISTATLTNEVNNLEAAYRASNGAVQLQFPAGPRCPDWTAFRAS